MEEIDLDPLPDLLNIPPAVFYKGFPPEAVFTLLALALLVFLSALVSGSETAFFSLKPVDMDALKNKHGKKGEKVLRLLEKPKELLATVLISNNFINVGIVILSTYFSSLLFNLKAYPVGSFIIQVVVITSVILIFGEILPKILANKNPAPFAMFMAQPVRVLITLFKPLSAVLVSSTSMIDKKIGRKGYNISYSELSDAIDITVDSSTPEEEKMILKGIATFGEKEASEIMRSRVNVTALEINTPYEEVLKTVVESGFSRIPVYEETFDKVKGILYIKDLLPDFDKGAGKNWTKLLRKPFFVPENKKINDLLQEFREKKIHMAIVVDEYGGTSGIITLEDIIEEIVGEINDEFDVDDEQYRYRQVSDNTYIFEAKVPLNDVCRILKLDDNYFDDVRGEADSLGGLILEAQGTIPPVGTSLQIKDFQMDILSADERKIEEVKVKFVNKKDEKQNKE